MRDGKIKIPWNRALTYGAINNIYSNVYPEYRESRCGDYQSKVLTFLHDIQSNASECSLLNGYEFGPIQGAHGGHHAVVIYPKGTDWKQTGTVLDPWSNQKPETFTIQYWNDVFSPATGSLVKDYRGNYPTTKDPNDYLGFPYWTAADSLFLSIGGIINCPVDILITDEEGRRSGVLENGSMAYEIPGSLIMRVPDSDGGKAWYFVLNSPSIKSYNLKVTGTDNGTCELAIFNAKDNKIRYYGAQSISKGSVIQISLDTAELSAPLILPDGRGVPPTIVEIPPSLGNGTGGGNASIPDLAGVWRCDDGGTYYIRQSGDSIWWFGEPSTNPGGWSNVANGTIREGVINLVWSDVPKGCTLNKGTLALSILSNDKLTATDKTGGFGGSNWTRIALTACPSLSNTSQRSMTTGLGATTT